MQLKNMLYLFLFLLFPLSSLKATNICIIQNWAPSEAEFFDPSGGRDEGAKAIYLLKTRLEALGHKIYTMKTLCDFNDADIVISFNDHHNDLLDQCLSCLPQEKVFLFLWEPPSVDPRSYDADRHVNYSRVYTWNDDLVDGKKYRKFYYPNLRKPMIAQKTPFAKKRLCTLIACNKTSRHPNELYTHRMLAIRFFEKSHPADFDFYGPGWLAYATYRGTIKEKAPVLEKYRFNLAYENIMGINGYVTEKIFDSFYGGSVPVYWGASNIEYYVPKDCFVDRRAFGSNEELYQFLKNMSEQEHTDYLNNIRAFLESENGKPFTKEYFVDWFIQEVVDIE